MRAKYSYSSPSLRIWVLPIPIRVERVRILEETNGNRTLRIAMFVLAPKLQISSLSINVTKPVIPTWIAGIQATGMYLKSPSLALDTRFPSWSLGTRRTLIVFALLRVLRVFVVNAFLC